MVKEKDESAKADKANKKGVKDSRAKDVKPAQEKTPKKVADKKESAKKPEGKADSQDASKAKAAKASPALSATSLIFKAPDLPPVEPRKKGAAKKTNEVESESHLRRRSRRRAGEPIDVNPDSPNVVVKVRTPRPPKEPSNEPAQTQDGSLIGNVYLGKVQNVLPSMEAAFVDIGRGRNAVLYSGEVNWEADGLDGQPRKIELALKSGDTLLVQVTKDSVGQKGARLTSQVSLPGRYVVYVPNGNMNGISRKLPESERVRLKKILKDIVPEEASVIVRTAAEGATEEQLTLDVARLQAQWDGIQKKIKKATPPTLLHSEPDLLVKIVRDVFNEDFQKMVISGADAQAVITEYLESVAPDLLERVEIYDGKEDLFERHRVGEQIGKALERKVYLPSGGSLVIDRTEAMTVVDVNTGKFVGSGGNLEETVTKNNLEAAEEIVRQLRLRDIGGIIVVDFIDMVLESNRDLVSRRLIECLGRDRTKHQVAEVTSLGLVQMTRKKLGLGLLESFSEPCEVCSARGAIVHHEPIMRVRNSNDSKPDKKRKGHMEVANVVTPERASEINSVVAKIAASTMGTGKIESKKSGDQGKQDPTLERILDALPEPKAEVKPDSKPDAKRKPRRATSPAKVDPGA